MVTCTQRQSNTHTTRGCPLPVRQDIYSQWDAGLDVKYHNLTGGYHNHTTSPLGITNTYKVGNSRVENEFILYIRRDNSYKYDRKKSHQEQEQEARAPTTSTKNNYDQHIIIAWVIGANLPPKKTT